MERTKQLCNAIYLDLCNVFHNTKRDFTDHWRAQVNAGAVAFVQWFIKRRAVQEAIAGTFAAGTPLCAVLENAVDSSVEDKLDNGRSSVDADDIRGLDEYIGNELQNITNERWFGDAVHDVIDTDRVAEHVTDELSDNRDLIESIGDQVLENHLDKITDAIVEELKARAVRRRAAQQAKKQ